MDGFLASRRKQIELIAKYDEERDDEILKDYPKLLNGIKLGNIKPDAIIQYLEDSITNYERSHGDHEMRKFESDMLFSQKVAKDTNFYEKKGLIPPTKKNIEEAVYVAKQKMQKQKEGHSCIKKLDI